MSSSTSSEAENPRLAALPGSADAAPAGPGADATAEPPQRSPEGVSRKVFLVVLVAFLLAAVALAVQSQRVGGFQAEIAGLEGEVAGLTGELAASNLRVQGLESQQRQARTSVQLLLQDLQALEHLLAGDPAQAGLLAAESSASSEATEAAEAAPLAADELP